MRYQKLVYICTPVTGRLAQLVQSTSFTPRGSGVRTPHRPLKFIQFVWTFFISTRSINSVGSECHVDNVEVTGSNPVWTTSSEIPMLKTLGFLFPENPSRRLEGLQEAKIQSAFSALWDFICSSGVHLEQRS